VRVRRIAHIDMDAFYASVELLRRPELRELPVAIAGRGGRGVVTTANYVARRFGVRSAMPARKALDLCPDCVFLPVDFDEYRKYSHLFKAAVATIAGRTEDRGIDEVYVDLTDVEGETIALGRVLKQRIFDACGLTCSIGIAPNKLLAKICSDLDKPDGLTILEPGDLERRIWPLPVRRINGVGPKASARLNGMGIESIGDLARHDPAALIERFGANYGRWLHDVGHGRDERPIVTESEPRSRSRETTFERDLHPLRDRAELTAIFTRLCANVAQDLQKRRYVGRTVGIKLRFDDFRTVTRDQTIQRPTADALEIQKAARACLKRVPLDRKLRLLGVRVSALSAEDARLGRQWLTSGGESLPLFSAVDQVAIDGDAVVVPTSRAPPPD